MKRLIEESFGGAPFYFLVEAASGLLGLRRIDPGKGIGLGAIRRKLLGVRFRVGFRYNFLRLDLKKAYEHRLGHCLAILRGILPGDKEGAARYLAVMAGNGLSAVLEAARDLESLELPPEARGPMGVPGPGESRRVRVSRMLMCGPAAEPAALDFDQYDRVVFNKPPPDGFAIDPGKILLVLNNQWIKDKSESLLAWLSAHPGATVICPRDIGSSHKASEVFEFLPRFPLEAALMGLQRNLFILDRLFETSHLDVVGFDFSLSRNPYRGWYPSMMNEVYGGVAPGVVKSNCEHDFLLNFLFTKNFLRRHPHVHGEIRDICTRDVGEIFALFSELYGSPQVGHPAGRVQTRGMRMQGSSA